MRRLPLALLLVATPAAAESWHERCAAASAAAAFKPCEEALIDDPNDTLALKRLADIYLGSHGEWRAVEFYGRRIALQPDSAEAWFDQAAALATMWHFAEAIEPLRKALELDPGNLGTQRLAAIVFEQAGEAGEAFAAHRALAEAGIATGMYDLAKDYHFGRGTSVDGPQAALWYERAAEAGHVAAMQALAEYLPSGALGIEDAGRADYWRQQAEAIRRAYDE